MKSNAKAIKAAAKTADDAKAAAKRDAAHKAHQAQMQRWVAHLVKLTGGIKDYSGEWSICKMLEAAGGYAKAREGYSL
jgi:hypothetical protein